MAEKQKQQVDKKDDLKEDYSSAIELVLNIKEIEKKDPEATGRIKAFIDGVNAAIKKV